MGLTAYIFAGMFYEFYGGLWLSTLHGGLGQQLRGLAVQIV